VANEEFSNKSEAVNYLIKRSRDQDAYHAYMQMKIDRGLKSGFSKKSKEELFLEIKRKFNFQL
jgi:antitoxin ParD1/3/4